MTALRFIGALGVLVSLVVLWGCGGPKEDELQQWMAEQRSQAKPQIAPVAAPKKFLPQVFIPDPGAEPFNGGRLGQTSGPVAAPRAPNTALLAPELNRRREPLESTPLDNIRMVGSFNKAGQMVAIIKVGSLLYQVKPGNYLGSNYGRIMKVSETQIVLREIVQDATGDWIERPATLQLQ
jgi:type IV pilus assembly protein PilP